MWIKSFQEISKNDVEEVGGKGASLGEMANAGISVPPGFVITTETYNQFSNQELPTDVIKEIIDSFEKLESERVAIRSSAVAEDSTSSSWAGQLESYLNTTRENLVERIRDCWNSIKTERALEYAAEAGVNEEDLAVAVVVQKMVESEVSGVIFTANPITKNKDEIMIEAGFGLGEMLVQGMITPDNFLIDKNSLEIKEKTIETQETMMVFQDGENKEVPVPKEKKDQSPLPDEKVNELAKLAIKIEDHYGKPQDIEWAIDNEGNIWIVQSRPITTLAD